MVPPTIIPIKAVNRVTSVPNIKPASPFLGLVLGEPMFDSSDWDCWILRLFRVLGASLTGAWT